MKMNRPDRPSPQITSCFFFLIQRKETHQTNSNVEPLAVDQSQGGVGVSLLGTLLAVARGHWRE